jgi:ribonuclease HI
MENYSLFTDGSVQPQTGDGYGAALLIGPEDARLPFDELSAQIQIYKFTETSSTRLELQVLLRALRALPTTCHSLNVYTDSQNILSLPERRARLEMQEFKSQKGKPLKNSMLYKSFFEVYDLRDIALKKVKGHQPSSQRDDIGHRFSLVDRAARKACRIASVSIAV